jgi:hypothetical protein
MGYYEIPFSSANISNEKKKNIEIILSNDFVAAALAAGGFIAGGWVRHLLDPRSTKNESNVFSDIDIFFENKDQINKIIGPEGLIQTTPEFNIYESKFALNKLIKPDYYFSNSKYNSYLHIPVQLIVHEKLIQGSIEKTLDSFDISNCKVAIKGNSFIIHDEFFDIHESNKVHLASFNSPFTLQRVNKYINRYNYKGVSEESFKLLEDWAVEAYKDFPEHQWMFSHSLESSLKREINYAILNRDLEVLENMSLFIGKWSVWSHYGKIDFIVNSLNNRDRMLNNKKPSTTVSPSVIFSV